MEKSPRRLTWLSALGTGEEWTPGSVTAGGNPLVRVTAGRGLNHASEQKAALFQDESTVRRRKADVEVNPAECQRAFDEARKLHPDALYGELSAIAAERLRIPARHLRRHVPNPFR